jgi:hypothetical protein
VLPTVLRERHIAIDDGPVELAFELQPPPMLSPSCDVCCRRAVTSWSSHDGRYLSVESVCSFTGRVVGANCVTGTLRVERFAETDL